MKIEKISKMHTPKERRTLESIFGPWEETIIWSCLQGVMGELYSNYPRYDAGMAILGDFAFYAGKPCRELLLLNPQRDRQDFLIQVPQNAAWAELIEECYGTHAKKVSRYALKKEKDVFDQAKLQQAVAQLAEGYSLRLLTQEEYRLCQNNRWAGDLVSQFPDYSAYQKLGIGVVVLKERELVAGASSYSSYNGGIEIEVDTRSDHRGKGLAYACAAKLILECLERKWYPSWDAQNLWSVALAEKLGYHYSHTYTAYEITGSPIVRHCM